MSDFTEMRDAEAARRFAEHARKLGIKQVELPFPSMKADGILLQWRPHAPNEPVVQFPLAATEVGERINEMGKYGTCNGVIEFINSDGERIIARDVPANQNALRQAGFRYDSEATVWFGEGRFPHGQANDVFHAIIKHPQDVTEALKFAAEKGDIVSFRDAMEKGADVKMANSRGTPLAESVVMHNHPHKTEMLEALLSADDSISPNLVLSKAVGSSMDNKDVVKFLLDKGADPLSTSAWHSPTFLHVNAFKDSGQAEFDMMHDRIKADKILTKPQRTAILAQTEAIRAEFKAGDSKSPAAQLMYDLKQVWNEAPKYLQGEESVPQAIVDMLEPMTDQKRAPAFRATLRQIVQDNRQMHVDDMVREFATTVAYPQAIMEYAKQTGRQVDDALLKELEPLMDEHVNRLVPVVRKNLLAGRSIDKIVGLSEAWHDTVIPDALRPIKAQGEWHPLTKQAVHEVPGQPGIYLEVLTTADQLRDEGDFMKHCVGRGGYTSKCLSGNTHIISVRRKGVEEPIATIEAEWDRSNLEIKQNHGPGNSPAPDEAVKAADWFKGQVEGRKIELNYNLGETEASKKINSRPKILNKVGFEITQENIDNVYDEYTHNNKRRGRDFNPETKKFDIASRNTHLIQGNINEPEIGADGKPMLTEKGKPKIVSKAMRDVNAAKWFEASGIKEEALAETFDDKTTAYNISKAKMAACEVLEQKKPPVLKGLGDDALAEARAAGGVVHNTAGGLAPVVDASHTTHAVPQPLHNVPPQLSAAQLPPAHVAANATSWTGRIKSAVRALMH